MSSHLSCFIGQRSCWARFARRVFYPIHCLSVFSMPALHIYRCTSAGGAHCTTAAQHHLAGLAWAKHGCFAFGRVAVVYQGRAIDHKPTTSFDVKVVVSK